MRVLDATVNRITRSGVILGPEQRLSPYQGLKTLTTWASHQYFEEDTKGTLTVGKNADFTHFVWIGSPDIKTALSNTKKMFSDPAFAEFSKKVSGVRKVVNTIMSVRVMDF